MRRTIKENPFASSSAATPRSIVSSNRLPTAGKMKCRPLVGRPVHKVVLHKRCSQQQPRRTSQRRASASCTTLVYERRRTCQISKKAPAAPVPTCSCRWLVGLACCLPGSGGQREGGISFHLERARSSGFSRCFLFVWKKSIFKIVYGTAGSKELITGSLACARRRRPCYRMLRLELILRGAAQSARL